MDTFKSILEQYTWTEMQERIQNKTDRDVLNALNKTHRNMDDFMALVSPAAEAHIESIAHKSRELSLKRFGRTMRLYIPLYLSNECANACIYCGFNCKHKIERTSLDFTQMEAEFKAIKKMGFDSVLLVTGEHPKNTALEQFAIDDDRSPQEMAEMLKAKGYDAVWKDWDAVFEHQVNNNE